MFLAQFVINSGAGFNFCGLLSILLFLTTWLITLLVLWRGVRALESIAQSLRENARKR